VFHHFRDKVESSLFLVRVCAHVCAYVRECKRESTFEVIIYFVNLSLGSVSTSNIVPVLSEILGPFLKYVFIYM
jgi:hypothetical protein